MAHRNLKILITEPSIIVRSGIAALLKRISHYHIQISENSSLELTAAILKSNKPDLLIINPYYWGIPDLKKLRNEANCPDLKCIAINYAPVADAILNHYDGVISLHDNTEIVDKKIEKIFKTPNKTDFHETGDVLSAREKEILACVVKGMTNKAIGSELFLSTHTVISHRRNISKKLEIHSTAGLTVYAIMNKLVELDEINNLKDK